MCCISNEISTNAPRRVVRGQVLLMFAMALCSATTVLANGRMIVVSPTTVQQGDPVKVKSPACNTAPKVLVDDKLFPATGSGADVELTTSSLLLGNHVITDDCEGVRSDPVALTIVAPKPTPTVLCARNASPRDGMALPFTSAARTAEAERVRKATADAVAQKQPFPTPEETSLLLARCDKDWGWTLRLEDTISLNVAGFAEWRAVEANAQKQLHVFIDGIELTNATVHYISTDPDKRIDRLDAILTFATDATTPDAGASRAPLAQVLRTARAKEWYTGTSEAVISIGPSEGPQWPTTARIRINPYPKALTWSAVLGVLALLAVLVLLARKTPLLRDSGGGNAPFSLAKNQMAVWFLVVFGSFLFVTVTTGQAAAMSTTALTLIGISGATGLAAIAIDSRKRSVETSDRQALEAERDKLKQEIDGDGGLRQKRGAVADGSAEAAQLDATLQARLQQLEIVTKKLDQQPAPPQHQKSAGWWRDLLSDEHGVSFHRLQMVAWTVAMVAVFIVTVWRSFAMADFDATMLALLGISSGTYLGFKFPERDTSPNAPTE